MPRALESGDETLIAACLDDRLHQPSRSKLISGYDIVRARALDAGAARVAITGSGPTILCVVKADKAEAFTRKMEAALTEMDLAWECLTLDCDRAGARVI